MHRPFIHRALEIRPISQTRFGVFACEAISRGTKVEICAILPITKQAVNAIVKTNNSTADKLFQNPDGVIKERTILNSIKEMELEKRLDAGLLTPEDLKRILLDSGNLTQILDIETAGFLLGYGSFYNRSQYPNVVIEYNSDSKLYDIIAVKDISTNTELTYLKR